MSDSFEAVIKTLRTIIIKEKSAVLDKVSNLLYPTAPIYVKVSIPADEYIRYSNYSE